MSRQRTDTKNPLETALFQNDEQDKINNEWKLAAAGEAKSQYSLALKFKERIPFANYPEALNIALHLKKILEIDKKNLEARLQLAICYIKIVEIKHNEDYAKLAYQLLNGLTEDFNAVFNQEFIAKAYIHLGVCFEDGIGVEKQKDIAKIQYQKAETLVGDLDAIFHLVLMDYRDEKNDDTVFTRFKALAEKQHVKSQYYLGKCFKNGIGVEKNPELAFIWFSRAGQSNEPLAQLETAFAFESGSGIEQNEANAFLCFQLAAKNGSAVAQDQVGEYFELGKGKINYDCVQACYWYGMAASNNDRWGLYNYARCFDSGIGIVADPTKAKHYYLLAYKEKHKKAAYRLYLIYKHEDNKALMFQWCERAVKDEVFDARIALAHHLVHAEGCNKDVERATAELEKAIPDDKDNIATLTLIEWLTTGYNGVRKDEKEVVFRLESIAENSAEACFELACHFASAKGVVLNIPEAQRLYKKFINLSTDEERQKIFKRHYSCADSKHHALMTAEVTPLIVGNLNQRNHHIFLFFQNILKEGPEQDLPEAHFWLGCILAKGDQKATIARDVKAANQHLKFAADHFFIREYKLQDSKAPAKICCAAHVYADYIFHGYTGIANSHEVAHHYYRVAQTQYADFKDSLDSKKMLSKISKKILQCTGQLDIPPLSASMAVSAIAKPQPATKKNKARKNKANAEAGVSAAAAAGAGAGAIPPSSPENQEEEISYLNPFSAAFDVISNRIFAGDVREMVDSGGFKQQPQQIKQQHQSDKKELDAIWNLYNDGNYEQALLKFKSAPNHHRAVLGIIYCYVRSFRYKEAMQALAEPFKKNPDDIDFLYIYLRILSTMNMRIDDDKHFSRFIELKKQNPQNINIAVKYIRILLFARKNNQAMQEALSLYQQHPHHFRVLLVYIDCLIQRHQYHRVWQPIQNLMQEHPNDPKILFRVAKISLYINNHTEAMLHFQEILDKYPYFKPALDFLFDYYQKKRKYRESLALLLRDESQAQTSMLEKFNFLQKKYAGSEKRLYDCACVFRFLGKKKHAINFLKQVLEINPGHVLALINFNLLSTSNKSHSNNLNGIDKKLDRILVEKENVDYLPLAAYIAYAKILFKSEFDKDKEKAYALIDKVVEWFPNSIKAYSQRIVFYLCNDLPKSLSYCEEILKRFPYEPDAYLVVAEVFIKLKLSMQLQLLCQQARQILGENKEFLDQFNQVFIDNSQPPPLASSNDTASPSSSSVLQLKVGQAIASSLADVKPQALDVKHSDVAAEAPLLPAAHESQSLAAELKDAKQSQAAVLVVAATPAVAREEKPPETYFDFERRWLAKGPAEIDELTVLAQRNHVFAQQLLADIYCGFHKEFQHLDNINLAVFWWLKLAESGHSWAQYNLGLAYILGEGVEEDLVEAVKWNKRAADQGNLQALFRYALAFIQGEGGVPIDHVKATQLLFDVIAADQPPTELTNLCLQEIREIATLTGWMVGEQKPRDLEAHALIAAVNSGITLLQNNQKEQDANNIQSLPAVKAIAPS